MNDKEIELNKIKGSLIGGAIGDALGYQIEFDREVLPRKVVKFEKDFGLISDDTQMTLATANGILWTKVQNLLNKNNKIDYDDGIYLAYLDWAEGQLKRKISGHKKNISWISKYKVMSEIRSPGNACLSSLVSGIKGTIEDPINDSKGCGGLMRIAPIGLYFNPIEAGVIAAKVAAITHGHPLGIIPAYIQATLISYLMNENISIEEALNKSIIQFKNEYNIFDKNKTQYFFKLLEKAVELSKSNIENQEAIKSLGEGWVAEENLAIAIYSCLKYENNFKEAIICSVNHDGDSDSTGAVAGNIIGLVSGFDKIPSYYKENLEFKEIINELSNDLLNFKLSNLDKINIEKYNK